MERWKQTYWAVWISNLVTAIGMMSFLPFFPGHLRALGLTDPASIAAWAGVIYGTAPLSAALTAPIWGALGDRIGRRLMVLRSMLAITVFVGAMAFARSPLELFILRFCQGVFSGFLAPSMTLVSIVAPIERQGRVAGSLQTALAAGAIVGPMLGALVLSLYGVRTLYLCVSVLALASALLVVAFADEDHSQRREGAKLDLKSLLRGSARDLAELRWNRNLRSAVLLLFFIQFGMGATNPLLELFVEDLWRGDRALAPAATGALFSVVAGVNLLAMPLWGRYGDRRGHARAMHDCAVASGLALAVHAAVPFYGALVLARVVLGGATAGSGPCAFGVAAAETSTDRRGGAFGVVFSARALAIAVAAMLGGVLSSLTGYRGLFVFGAACVLLPLWRLGGTFEDPGG